MLEKKINPDDILLTPADVQARLQISDRGFRRLVQSGQLIGIKLQGQWRVEPREYQAFLDRLRALSNPASAEVTADENQVEPVDKPVRRRRSRPKVSQ